VVTAIRVKAVVCQLWAGLQAAFDKVHGMVQASKVQASQVQARCRCRPGAGQQVQACKVHLTVHGW
jgi:hypothetical protein